MLRLVVVCACVVSMALAQRPQRGRPEFPVVNVPFEDWLEQHDNTRMRWELTVLPPHLTESQRLVARITAKVDSQEIAKRPKPGQFLLFLHIRDQDQRIHRIYQRLLVEKGHTPSEAESFIFSQEIGVVPGDYEVAGAIYDSDTKEHNVKQVHLHVPELHHDPLPGCWRDLPKLDYFTNPRDESRLNLPLTTTKPVRIEVIAVSSSDVAAPFFPLVVLSQMTISNGTMNVTVLDLDHRRASLIEDVRGRLDRAWLARAMAGSGRYKVDIHALENHKEAARFFASEVRKRLEAARSGDSAPVMIVLSAPQGVPKESSVAPIETSAEAGIHLFYLRRRSMRDKADSLEHLLKPLNPHVFDLWLPNDLRNALGTMIKEISDIE